MAYRNYNGLRLRRRLNDFILALLGAFIALFAIHKAGWVESVSIPGAIIGWLLLIAVVVRLGWLFAQIFCVIRANPATDSDAIRPPIPTEAGHPFRSNPAT